jgi:hypothetical protein
MQKPQSLLYKSFSRGTLFVLQSECFDAKIPPEISTPER